MTRFYYIQNVGFCGDCLRWWREDRNGYTSNLDDALLVTKAEARNICRDRPREDIPRPATQVDKAAHRHVNFESVKNKRWWTKTQAMKVST